MAATTPKDREALTARIAAFLKAHYTPEQAASVHVGFRGATATLEVERNGERVNAGILRATGDVGRWGLGTPKGSKYTNFWVGGHKEMPPEWAVAMAIHYAGVTAAGVPGLYGDPNAMDVERWVVKLIDP